MSKTNAKTEKPMKNIYKLVVGIIVIAVLTLAAYIPAMRAGYIWDDDMYLTDNPLIVDSNGLYRIWFSQDSPTQYFPMVFTSFRLEYKLWGLNPSGYHVINIILHIINAILLWRLLQYLSIPAAWFAAAIFALHPVQVESVAWITERKNLLMAFFFFLSLMTYLRFIQTSDNTRFPQLWYVSSLVFYAASLLSKTTACTMPAAIVLLLWLMKKPLNKNRWAQIMPYVVLGLAMGLLTLWWELYHQGTAAIDLGLSALDRILIASRAIWFYLFKLVWPFDLAFSYPKWQINADEPIAYLWILACAGAGFALWYWRKQAGRGTIAAVIFFVTTLFPMLGVFPLYTFSYTYVADHYQYLAAIGPIALIVASSHTIVRHRGKQLKFCLISVAGLLLATLVTLTWQQSLIYKDEKTLWEDTLRKNPQSVLALNNLAVEIAETEPEKAIALLKKTIALNPRHTNAMFILGTLYLERGNSVAAVSYFEKILQVFREDVVRNPNNSLAYNNMGYTFYIMGDYENAFNCFRKAITVDPGCAHSRRNLENMRSLMNGKADSSGGNLIPDSVGR